MTINNIALVRATNVIPLDGIIKPISNVPYLCKNIGLEFSFRMSDLLREVGIIPQIDQSKMFDDGYYDEITALSAKILKEYLPYVSDYNSFVLFSLNGLCPDDNEHGFANNTFSNKKVAIIEPLSYHIEEAISLVPTDTAIKGNIHLSDEAILLIQEDFYNNLNEEQKLVLQNNKFAIKIFNGPLKEVIRMELQNSERYIPETLSLSASTGGIMPSETSEMQKRLIDNIASTYGLSKSKYFNLITSKNSNMPKYKEVCDEFENAVTVQDYFMQLFLTELLSFLNAPIDMISNISQNIYNKTFLLKVIELIKSNGVDNYKKFVDIYNVKLEEQRENKTLLTPREIISSIRHLEK